MYIYMYIYIYINWSLVLKEHNRATQNHQQIDHIQQIAKASTKRSIKAPHYCCFESNPKVNSPHKGPVMPKAFPYHDIVCHGLGFGHKTMVCAVCLSVFLPSYFAGGPLGRHVLRAWLVGKSLQGFHWKVHKEKSRFRWSEKYHNSQQVSIMEDIPIPYNWTFCFLGAMYKILKHILVVYSTSNVNCLYNH